MDYIGRFWYPFEEIECIPITRALLYDDSADHHPEDYIMHESIQLASPSDSRVQPLLQGIQDACAASFGANLVGVYVHGSLGFGCFRWGVSDVDFLVVTDSPPAVAEKADFLKRLLSLQESAPPKGLEMSVLVRRDCAVIDHPVPFHLHFSPDYRYAAADDLLAYASQPVLRDPDLAAHITVLHQAGFALSGPSIAQVFGPVPRAAYLDSILLDIADAPALIHNSPVYLTLNLCRVLAYAQSGLVLSKAQGGEWAIQNLPAPLRPAVSWALSEYAGGTAEAAPDAKQLARFSEEMTRRIHAAHGQSGRT